jgi:3-hydroxyacyl-CoA dehydrogenase/enoyl-CoA hydratase/3-hydroxybutyryl-CoA epimerase
MALMETTQLRVDDPVAGHAILWLDMVGRSVNVLSRQMLADLGAVLDRLQDRSDIRQLTIASAKPSGFLAGADLEEFALVETADQARAISAAGQGLFDRIASADLPYVIVAVIHGVCLGGGLELALACRHGVVVDHPKTQIGFPEIEIGLLPGWGGTQRLPRTVGLERALQVILGRKRLTASEAVRWGLANRALAVAHEPPPAHDELLRLQFDQGAAPRPARSWRQRILESNPLGRRLIFRTAAGLIRKKTPDDMPAPAEALKAVEVGFTQGLVAGLEAERAGVSRLAITPACRNLVGLFFQRERAKKTADGPAPRKIGVVGAGTMGAGIAQLAALKRFSVVVREVNDAALAAGRKRIEDLVQKAVASGVLSADDARERLATLGWTTAWDGFSNLDLVIEAALEDLDLKRCLFRDLEQHVRPDTILATNTSSLLVKQLQEGLAHPGRVAGLHFFNPVHKMPLVEVVRGPATEERVLAALTAWVLETGKTPVTVNDSPGFLVNRILMPYLNEAVLLASASVSIEAIDSTLRRFGMPAGPLELLDQVGLDVAKHISRALQPTFGDRYPPSTALSAMVDRGWFGQKNGVGFYRYQGKSKSANPELDEVLKLPARLTVAREPLRDRLVLLMVNEAAACLGEQLAADAGVIDLAMVFGTGWAPHRGGPLQYADDRGLMDVLQGLERLERELGPRFAPAAELRRRAATAERFRPRKINQRTS